MYDIIDLYMDELSSLDEFKELVELKKVIDKKYASLIISMKTIEAKYIEMKEYMEFRPEIKEIQRQFVEKKQALYSKPEVIRYLELEQIIQKRLTDDINELKLSISNKFTLTKMINL